jgi:DNA-directed RNA polymerase subunit RPC12/RpoP
MSTFSADCPDCGKSLLLDEGLANATIACPFCRRQLKALPGVKPSPVLQGSDVPLPGIVNPVIHFSCPTCHAALEHLTAGATASCPGCGQKVIVPTPAPTVAASRNKIRLDALTATPPPPSPPALDDVPAPRQARRRRRSRRDDGQLPAHRGSRILTVGAISISSGGLGVLVGVVGHFSGGLPALLAVITHESPLRVVEFLGGLVFALGSIGGLLGLVAWSMANGDLTRMQHDQMDDGGEAQTRLGYKLAIAGFLVSAVAGLMFFNLENVAKELQQLQQAAFTRF